MATRNDDWIGLWRSSAYEAVPYKEDFPECLLTLPELIDGSIAQGAATKIMIRIELNKSGTSTLTVRDNGKGIYSVKRLLNWASPKNEEGSTHHRYGHGSKKCLTKWAGDYDTAKWTIQFRKQDKSGLSGSLNIYTSPFRGPFDTSCVENETDMETLMPSGTQWTCNFDPNILDRLQTPDELYIAVKEIIRTRYSAHYFEKTEFSIEVIEGKIEKKGNSKIEEWTTFQQCLDDACISKYAKLQYNETKPFNNGIMTFKYYYIAQKGTFNSQLKSEFPVLGQKNMNCSRIHIGLNGRFIEARHIYKFIKRESNHNDYNGYYGIVNFEGDAEKMPTPCTTKVSFYENCPHFIEFTKLIVDIFKQPPIDPVMTIKTPPVTVASQITIAEHVLETTIPSAMSPVSPPVSVQKKIKSLPPVKPKITFNATKKHIHVVDNAITIYKIPYVGDKTVWIDICNEVLIEKEYEIFKLWCAALIVANKLI